MGPVVAFANHKGGCAKTTTVGNLGWALAELGRRVLLVDADPQANLSELLGTAEQELVRLEDVLPHPGSARDAVHGVEGREGLSVLPCSERLADVVAEQQGAAGAEWALREVLESAGDGFDVVLVDTPPALGALSSMALLAAEWVVVPARPADFDVGGAIRLADLIRDELAQFNTALRLLGVLVCQTDARWTLGAETRAALEQADIKRLTVEIPFAVSVGRAPRRGRPTVAIDPDGRVGSAYRALASDLDRALLA